MNNAAMYRGVQISVEVPAFNSFGYIPRSGIAGSYSNFVFTFLRNRHNVSHSACIILHSHQQYTNVPISPHSLTLVIFCFLDNSHPNEYEVASHCGFDVHFPNY